MADLGFAGLYVKIKDRTRPIKDRLKLVKFAWKSGDVLIPNKDQVLIDIICGLLINQKKNQLSEEDVNSVWECLYEILGTRRAHQSSTDGKGIVIQQSIPQLLADALAHTKDISSIKGVVGCCQAIVSSPALSFVFTARLDLMLTVLGSLCDKWTREEDNVSDLAIHIVDRYLKAMKSASNHNQIVKWMCDKLFPAFLPLMAQMETPFVQKLQEALHATFFHVVHEKRYKMYLLAKDKDSDPSIQREAKSVVLVVSAFKQALKQSEEVCQYIPSFYDGFVQSYRQNSTPTVNHHMFMELCRLIGVMPGSDSISGELPLAAVIRCLHRLIVVVKKQELYDLTEDEKNSGVQLMFYKFCVQTLLQNYCETPDWYHCLTTFLQLNHHILETSLPSLLLIGWIKVTRDIPDEVLAGLDRFLSELMVTYQKLRQTPKLMTKILDMLTSCQDVHSPILLPPLFIKSYAEVTQSLPQGMTVNIWKQFVSSMKDQFVEESAISAGHYQGICSLFHHYLMNVKVTDYSVTELTLKGVQDLTVAMETDIFAPLLKRFSENLKGRKEKLQSTLCLCHAWGEVMAMLALYKKVRASTLESAALVSHVGDLSYLHSYLDKQQWSSIYKKIVKNNEAALLHTWNMLCVQKVKVMLLFKDKSDWPVIGAALETLLNLPDDIDHKTATIKWSGRADDVTKENQLVARWQLMTSNMAAIQAVLPIGIVGNVAKFLVQTGASGNEEDQGHDYSLASISRSCLKHSWLTESSTLLGHIVTCIWERCSKCISGNVQRPKKKKVSSGLAGFQSVMAALSDREVDWTAGTNSDNLMRLSESCRNLSQLMGQVAMEPLTLDLQVICSCVQMISQLPLECLGSCDQVRCLTGILAVLVVVNQSKDGKSETKGLSEKDRILHMCVELCTVILETCGTAPVFQLVDPQNYLPWITSLLESSIQDGTTLQPKVLLLMEMSCSSMVRDYSVLEKLPNIVSKVCEGMENKDETEKALSGSRCLAMYLLQEITKMLNRAYLNDSLKSACNNVHIYLGSSFLALTRILDTTSDLRDQAVVVRSLASVLAGSFRDEKLRNVFLKRFSQLIAWCEGTLLNQSGSRDIFASMAALYFLHTVARCHKILERVFTADVKFQVWHSLIRILRNFITEESSQDTEGAVSGRSDPAAVSTWKETAKRKHESHMDSNSEAVDKIITILEGKGHKETVLSAVQNDRKNAADEKYSREITQSGSAEQVLSPAMITSLYKSLVFEGKLDGEKRRLLLMQLQTVMATLLASFSQEHFSKILHSIVTDVHKDSLGQDDKKIQAAIFVWRYLLRLEFSVEQTKTLRYAARNMMVNFQCILQQLGCHGDREVVMCVTLPVLHAQEQMVAFGPKFLPPPTTIMCLLSCVHVPLGGSTFVPVFHATCDLLDTLLVHQSETVFQNIPAFIGCSKKLLLAVVEQSNQDAVSNNTDLIHSLMGCAYQTERLFTLISSHKVEFGKVAMYVVSDYVTAVQRVTLLPAIKRALVPAVYKMLDLCDKYAVSQLHTVLSHGVTEVFRLLYEEYTKFHRYSGKV